MRKALEPRVLGRFEDYFDGLERAPTAKLLAPLGGLPQDAAKQFIERELAEVASGAKNIKAPIIVLFPKKGVRIYFPFNREKSAQVFDPDNWESQSKSEPIEPASEAAWPRATSAQAQAIRTRL